MALVIKGKTESSVASGEDLAELGNASFGRHRGGVGVARELHLCVNRRRYRERSAATCS